MNRSSWSSNKGGRIQLSDRQPSDYEVPRRHIPVPKAALEEGNLHLLATAAEMQQRRDLESANQLYEAAMAKMKAHKLDKKRFLTGTNKKPPPLNSRTAIEWSMHVGDVKSAITLLGDANTAFTQLISDLSTEQIVALIGAGADIEHRIGPHGRTFLLREAAEGKSEGVQLALDQGASIHCLDDNGDSALSLSLSNTSEDSSRIVSTLIDSGADVNQKDGQGQSMLRVAAAKASPEALKLIIDNLSPLNAERHKQMQEYVSCLPFDGEKLSDRTCGILKILLESGLDANTRCHAKGDPSLADIVLRQGGDTGTELASELLERGADFNVDVALQYAPSQVLELVFSHLTPLNETTVKQMMIWVQSIISSGRKWAQRESDVLCLLLEFGLDPNVRVEKPPHSPLILCAAKTGDAALVDRLIASKVDLSAANDSSETAIVVAAKQKNRQIYDAIKASGVNDKYFLGWTVWSHHANS